MTVLAFNCDRCKRLLIGQSYPKFTAGYYVVSEGAAWEKYAREGEHMVCDHCIQSDPEFQKVYQLGKPVREENAPDS